LALFAGFAAGSSRFRSTSRTASNASASSSDARNHGGRTGFARARRAALRDLPRFTGVVGTFVIRRIATWLEAIVDKQAGAGALRYCERVTTTFPKFTLLSM
jgi:hypothetical protein